MRCPDCNKFVSFEERDPEDIILEIDANGLVTGSCRITNNCVECGTELKGADIDLEGQVDVKDHKKCELSIEESGSTREQKSEGKGRYAKTFYGAEVTFNVTCDNEKHEDVEDTATGWVQASDMEELV